MRRILRWIWKKWLILTLLYTCLSVAATFIPPKDFEVLYFIAYSLPVACIISVVNIALNLFVRKRWTVLVANLVIALYGVSNNWAINFSEEKDEDSYTVMTYNVRLFDFYNWVNGNAWDEWKARTDDGAILDSIYQTIGSSNPDFLCIQEYFNQKRGDYQTEAYFSQNGYQYKHIEYSTDYAGNYYGIATFSKYPIIKKTKQFFGSTGPNNGILISDIQLPQDTLRLFNVHLESFRLKKADYKYLNQLVDSNLTDVETEPIWGITDKVGKAFDKRSKQLTFLLSQIRSSPHPVLVCGDFNELPNSYLHRQISMPLNDGFLEKGFGLGTTLTSGIPGLRIDYTFHSDEIEAQSHRVIERVLSDHYPVVFDFRLNED